MEPVLWLSQMGRACLWGSVTVAAVGAACRCLPRLPAAVRAWLWWLACTKLLLGLWTFVPISLPVLPAPVPASRSASAVAAAPLPQTTLPATRTLLSAAPAFPETEAAAVPAASAPRWPLLLFACWISGVAIFLGFAGRQRRMLRRSQRGTFPAAISGSDLDTLARQMGLRHAPRVLAGPNVQTPCVAGWLRPVILLPLGLSEMLLPAELRLILAHEMAHLKRFDLPLAAVPLLARALFFFHPFAWWAAAEWAAAREEACDVLALAATQLPPADYGRLLLKLAAPAATPPALGFSPGYHALRRRLVGLSCARPAPRRARLLPLALPLLLPWRLSAALPPAEAHSSLAPARYSIVALADDTDSEVSALNNAGEVALSVRTEDGAQGYAGSVGTLAALSALPKHHASLAYGLSDAGQAAGASFNIPGHARAFWWDGATHKIGSLPGYPYSEARGISSAGDIAGFSETGHADRERAWVTRAFLRRPGEALTDLGTLGGPYSAAYAVNALGTVVGKADTDTGATHAFAWSDGQMTDLGTLGGANSVAYAVSGTGGIAGASEIDDAGTRHAFLYADAQMQDLAPVPGMTGSAAYALNAGGQVAGTSQVSGAKHATLWRNGLPVDLNSLLPPHSGWTLTEARAINDHGQVAGMGLFQGRRRAFLLTPY